MTQNRQTTYSVGNPAGTSYAVPFPINRTLTTSDYKFNFGQLAYEENNARWVIYTNHGIWIPFTGSGSGVLSITPDTFSPPGTSPILPDSSTGTITITGNQVAAGSIGAHVINTDSLAANSLTIQIQRASAVASTDLTKNGVSHFNSTEFTVDANGFVSLLGGTSGVTNFPVDTFTGPGTNPVVPSITGAVTITGGQVAAGTTTNVIRTDSLAANTYTIQIQRSQAVASTTIGDNGVSHFSSAQFAVDANGFVTLAGGSTGPVLGLVPDAHTGPGTTPVVPNGSGNIIVTGAQVASGTVGANVIRF